MMYCFWLHRLISEYLQGTALRICLLLLDVALVSNHASRSAVSSAGLICLLNARMKYRLNVVNVDLSTD